MELKWRHYLHSIICKVLLLEVSIGASVVHGCISKDAAVGGFFMSFPTCLVVVCLPYPVTEFVTKVCDNKMLIVLCMNEGGFFMSCPTCLSYPVTGFVTKIFEGQYLHLQGVGLDPK